MIEYASKTLCIHFSAHTAYQPFHPAEAPAMSAHDTHGRGCHPRQRHDTIHAPARTKSVSNDLRGQARSLARSGRATAPNRHAPAAGVTCCITKMSGAQKNEEKYTVKDVMAQAVAPLRKAIRSARSFALFRPGNTIFVPGMYFFGLIKYSPRVSSPHVMPEFLLAAV